MLQTNSPRHCRPEIGRSLVVQKHVKSLRTLSQGFCVFKGLHWLTWSRYNQQVQLHKLMLGIIRACSRNCMYVLTSGHAIPFSFHPSDILLELTKLGLLQLLWLQAGSSGSKLFRSYCVAHVFGERPKMGIDTKGHGRWHQCSGGMFLGNRMILQRILFFCGKRTPEHGHQNSCRTATKSMRVLCILILFGFSQNPPLRPAVRRVESAICGP